MPTRDGDVVILRNSSESLLYAVWHVDADLQQTPNPSTNVSTAHGRLAALNLAKLMARESRGAVFLVESDLTWTKLSD